MKSAVDRFRPDEANPEDLSDQLAGWLRERIVTGSLKPGEKLPSMQTLADTSRVSFKTARQAVERLSREGYVRARPHIGTVVLPKKIAVWHGRVLLLVPEEDETSYFVNAFLAEVRKRLTSSGYQAIRVCFSRNHKGTNDPLEVMLGQRVDFALVFYGMPKIFRMLSAAGVPSAGFCGTRPQKGGKYWSFPVGDADAVDRFVNHCRRVGVRTVTEVDFGSPGASSAAAELAAVGITVRHITVRPQANVGRLEGIERASFEHFRKFNRNEFPDLFLVWDDYVARGLLTAFLERGIRVPEDVNLVAFANAGFAPVFPKALTRIEHDPVRCGAQAANFILSILAKGRVPVLPIMAPTYIIGETFPYS